MPRRIGASIMFAEMRFFSSWRSSPPSETIAKLHETRSIFPLPAAGEDSSEGD